MAIISDQNFLFSRLIEKSVIIHKDENGFGLRIKGQSPVFIEHVHENGAAWRAGVRALDLINKVNGIPVSHMDHKDVVLTFKTCSRFVALTLISPEQPTQQQQQQQEKQQHYLYTGTSLVNSVTIDQIAPELTKQAALASRTGNTSNTTATLSNINKSMPKSMSANLLPSLETQTNNLRLALANKKPPALAASGLAEKRRPLQPSNLVSQPQPSNLAQAPLPSSSSSLSAPTAHAPLTSKRSPVVNRRIEIIREFIDTERTHTERLRCLIELFYRPLKQAGFMSVEQLRMVFSCLRTLYKIHREIYRILMSANYDAYSEPLIGSALLEIFEGDLKRRLERASCTFCSAQATNTELLNKLTRRDTKAGEFLAQVTSQRMVGRLGVKDLLASCFQRLTKYPLLLENLLKATPLELPDDDSGGDDDADTQAGNQARNSRRSTVRRRSQHHNHHQQPRRQPSSQQQQSSSMSQERLEGRRADVDEGGGGCCDDSVGDGVANNASRREAAAANSEAEEDYSDNDDEDYDDDNDDDNDDDELRLARLGAAEEARRNSRRIMAISLAEEREFIERALHQSRQILVRVNDAIKVAIARNRLKEIWKRTDKYPDVPLSSIDISKQHVVHEGLLTLRLSKRSFDVYVLLLNDYIIILTREGQDKYRLKFFTPEGKSASFQSSAAAAAAAAAATTAANSSTASSSSSTSALGGTVGNILGAGANGGGSGAAATLGVGANNNNSTNINNLTAPHQTVYSPIFLIDEHLTTRDAATDENGFYLLCKRKDDSRIYEFASRSPAERLKWRDKIQAAIERQMSRTNRRPSCASTITKSSSEISANEVMANSRRGTESGGLNPDGSLRSSPPTFGKSTQQKQQQQQGDGLTTRLQRPSGESRLSTPSSEPTKIVGTISYVIDDGIVMPSKMESSRVFVDQAIQVNILDGSTLRGQIVATQATN